jgi:hypothetical protein
LRRFLDLAGRRGIRVKLCLEEFRDIKPKIQNPKDNSIHHRANGGPFVSMQEFLDTEAGRALFLRKVAFYRDHIGDHPAVFGWELWNEMDCVKGDWVKWTERMLPELHQVFPKNMVLQSLGSFDNGPRRASYRRLSTMPGNDAAQVHRYLDAGAALEVCHGPVDMLAADAVRELLAFQAGKPVLLAETGAVNRGHSGVFDLYAKDKAGTILHDTIFAPFFAGAAGTGHTWFWRQCIDEPNQWYHFARFARALEGIDPLAEHFEPVAIEHPRLRVYLLRGKKTLLAWLPRHAQRLAGGTGTRRAAGAAGRLEARLEGSVGRPIGEGRPRLLALDRCLDRLRAWGGDHHAAAVPTLPRGQGAVSSGIRGAPRSRVVRQADSQSGSALATHACHTRHVIRCHAIGLSASPDGSW